MGGFISVHSSRIQSIVAKMSRLPNPETASHITPSKAEGKEWRVRLAHPLYSYTGQEPSQRNNACLDVVWGLTWLGQRECRKAGVGWALSADGDTAAAETLSVLILHSSCPREGFYCCEGTHDQKQAGEERVCLTYIYRILSIREGSQDRNSVKAGT